MTLLETLLIVGAGFAAGVVNTVVGSGSLITYPVLVALGYPPVAANIANTVGLTPGSITGALGYRRELRLRPRDVAALAAVAALGAVVGAALLLALPSAVFRSVAPVLILLATALVGLQPFLPAPDRRRRPGVEVGPWMLFALGLTSVYGGYFSAAQGVLILGVLGVMSDGGLQQHNAIKNLLQAAVNLVASAFFVIDAHPAWPAVALIALGAFAGGRIGAAVGRRTPVGPLRIGVILIGIGAAALMIVS